MPNPITEKSKMNSLKFYFLELARQAASQIVVEPDPEKRQKHALIEAHCRARVQECLKLWARSTG